MYNVRLNSDAGYAVQVTSVRQMQRVFLFSIKLTNSSQSEKFFDGRRHSDSGSQCRAAATVGVWLSGPPGPRHCQCRGHPASLSQCVAFFY